MLTATPLEIAACAFDRHQATHPLGHYTGILSLQGLARLAVWTRDAAWIGRAREELLPFVRGERVFKCNFPNYLTGGNGTALLFRAGHLPEAADAVRRHADQILNEAPRAPDGLLTMPATPGTDRTWIDAAFAVCPFLIHAGVALGRDDYVEESVRQIDGMIAVLRDDATGLLHQARGFSRPDAISEDHWSRGNGWALLALAELVDGLPENHRRRPGMERHLADLLHACLRVQDADGVWHHELTLSTSFVETSGSGLILFALAVALHRRLLPESHWRDFERGLRGLAAYVDDGGNVRNTCEPCLSPGDGSIAAYLAKKPVYNDPHGFGPVTLAFGAAHALRPQFSLSS